MNLPPDIERQILARATTINGKPVSNAGQTVDVPFVSNAIPQGRKGPRLPTINPNPHAFPSGAYQALWIPNWHPATLNRIMHGHWSNGGRLKKKDREVVQYAVKQCGLHSSDRPRGVSLHMILKKGQRAADPDAYWKTTLDALVQAGMLRADTPRFCTIGAVCFSRSTGNHWGTLIVLEDLP